MMVVAWYLFNRETISSVENSDTQHRISRKFDEQPDDYVSSEVNSLLTATKDLTIIVSFMFIGEK